MYTILMNRVADDRKRLNDEVDRLEEGFEPANIRPENRWNSITLGSRAMVYKGNKPRFAFNFPSIDYDSFHSILTVYNNDFISRSIVFHDWKSHEMVGWTIGASNELELQSGSHRPKLYTLF